MRAVPVIAFALVSAGLAGSAAAQESAAPSLKEFAAPSSESTMPTSLVIGYEGLRSCIDYKLELTTGGHNVGTDMAPNGIAVQCLRLGTDFLRAETQQIRGY